MMSKRLVRKTLSIDYLLQNIENKIISMKMNQKGATALLVLIAVVGLISFLALTSLAPFRDNLLTAIYPKNDSHALSNPAVTKTVNMVEQTNIPQPQNVKVWPNDRVATISWDSPDNTTGIVGYIVTYGKTADGPAGMTNNKQTIHNAVQIQPLENGQQYTVQVRSVKGSIVKKTQAFEPHLDGPDSYAVASGPVSPAVTATVTATPARVDAMKQRLTGFFDDFNLPAGPFDELKWNHSSNGCEAPGLGGQFINAQFHAHNISGSTDDGCGVNGNISRPRAIFDIAGRTEASPGQIEFDLDGISQLRDAWYLDLIPLSVRKNGIPMDVTAKTNIDDDDHDDPGNMLRIRLTRDTLQMHTYDINRNPAQLNVASSGMPCYADFPGPSAVSLSNCNMSQKTGSFSPLSQPDFSLSTIPNVRRHWVIQVTQQKVKVFVDGTFIASANMPSGMQSETKYVLHFVSFGYAIGKQFDTVMPTTTISHWDNFGFNGPTPTTVTHNYLDGGSDGTYPLLAMGMPGHLIPRGARSTKINIPDPIGSPVGQARLIFALTDFAFGSYTWNSGDHVLVNGKKYDFPNPQLNVQSPLEDIASTLKSHATGLFINPADLKQGINDIALNINSDIYNVHLEIDYDKNNAPSYTQPKAVFSSIDFNSVIMPAMNPNDDYWFVEQWMGLANVVPHNSTAPSATPTAASSSFPSATPVPSPSSPAASPSPAPSAKPGDVDGNNRVDIFDYNQLLTEFGRTGANIPSDLDKNGKVDIFDFNIVLTNFGK